MIYFVSELKPFSIQATGCQKYKQRLREEFEKYKYLYTKLPVRGSIYSKLVYIHALETDIDIDNMSKPFVDTFKGIIYLDDSIINHRICSKIMFDDLNAYELKLNNLPAEIGEKFNELVAQRSNHIVYYEIGLFSHSMVSIGV